MNQTPKLLIDELDEIDEIDGQEQVPTMTAEVPIAACGMRFDQVLVELFPDYSRSRLAEWIKSGDALLDGLCVKPKQAVRGGERIMLKPRMEAQVSSSPEAIDLDIRYQDDDVLVINKPAGLVVHPGAGNPRSTLVNALLYFDARQAELPRAGIVHRLDKDTSGLMVVARNLKAHSSLVEQLSSRDVHRQYLALVVGSMVAGGTVDAAIGRHPQDRLRQAVHGSGKPAVTHYRLREKFRAHTLVECRLETGRTHQIRVHMAYAKHPIVGDPLYGGHLRLPKAADEDLVLALRGFKRQALHAEKLIFRQPSSGQPVENTVPMPTDMQVLLEHLRRDSAAFKAKSG